MLHTLHMLYRFAGAWMKRFREYRGTLPLSLATHAVHYGGNLLMIWVLIDRFQRIGTWSPFEVLLLVAMADFSYGIANFFVRNSFRSLSEDVRTGDFDEFLIRPMSPLVYYVSKRVEFYDLNHVIFNGVVLVFVFYKLQVSFTVLKVFWLVVFVAGATVIQTSFIVITTVLSFWLVKAETFSYFVVNSSSGFANYPISIYPKAIQMLLTVALPWAFINFYPALYLLGKQEFLMFHPIVQFLTPAVAAVMLAIALLLWRLGLRKYQSTGT